MTAGILAPADCACSSFSFNRSFAFVLIVSAWKSRLARSTVPTFPPQPTTVIQERGNYMTYAAQNSASLLYSNLRVLASVAVLACMLAIVAVQPATAQTYQVLHHFTGGTDGSSPYAGLTMD